MPLTTIKSSNIKDAEVKNVDISPTAAIDSSKVSGIDTTQLETNAFNIGILGFKIAVNDGVTIFNLVDGVVDEFHDETGVDTAENSATTNYDSSGDFYQNLDSTPGVAMHLGVEAVTFENPAHAPLITFTSQEAANGAFGVQGSITFPSLTTSIEATMVGSGGGYHTGDGGPGGSVQGTITSPSIAGATWDYVVGEGGNPAKAPTNGQGGYGGGGSGYGGGGGFTGIFDDEVTIIEGGTYSEGGDWHIPGEPNPFPDEGPAFADTVAPANASEAVLIVGSGASGEASNGAPQAQGGGGGFLAGTSGSGPISTSMVGSGGTNPSGGGADQEQNGGASNTPYLNLAGGGTGESWTQESPHPDAIHFRGAGFSYPPYGLGSAGSGYHGGGGGTDAGGYTGGFGGGAGYSNPTYVPSPSLEYETAVGAASAPSPESTFDEAPYYTALPSPRQALFAAGAQGEGADGPGTAGGDGGILLVFDAGASATSMTLVSDTFTASTTPSTARIVVFAELPDGLSDFTVSATRDNTNYDTITLTDEGYSAGSSGIKIFSGSTPLTGAAGGQPQVQLRWKIVGTSLSNTNKIHGVALQWK